MSEARDNIRKLIKAKQDKIRYMRNKIERQQNIYNTVADFVKDVDNAIKNSGTFVDFNGMLDDAATKLNNGICRLDQDAHISIIWNNNENIDDTWRDLQVDSVVVTWGDDYVNKTKKPREETVDIGHLFLEGYFN